jgi:thymidylate kinase
MTVPNLKTSEDYRLVAEKCRQAARKESTEKERGHLLAIATRWDRIADYFKRHPRNSTG